MPTLFVIRGADQGSRFELGEPTVRIGRDASSTLQIHDNEVSRHHAEIRRVDDNYTLSDLDSSNGTFVNGQRVRTHRLASGDQIEVVLKITAKNTYDYLAFEDMKPAGCEPVELRSGGRWAGGLCANLELRDEKVVFFIGLLEQGEHVLRYKLRAETPGHFHALPAKGFAMYVPEVNAISDEMRLRIKE